MADRHRQGWRRLGVASCLAMALLGSPLAAWALAECQGKICGASSLEAGARIRQLAQKTAVRILTPSASGSGTIVRRQGQIYTVLTCWHVVAFSERVTVIAPDGQRYAPVQPPRQLGNADMAVIQLRSAVNYEVARASGQPPSVGEPVFATGFPMYGRGTLKTTFELGINAFEFNLGQVSLLLPKSLAQGYQLGYTNDIEVGMSGGPIFNSQGLLIGINGRLKNRDPDFGVYAFEDGTEPSGDMLELMVNSSWGIPISTYLASQGKL